MSAEDNPTKVADQVVAKIEFTLTVDGEVVDSTKDDGPLEYLHGYDNLISGLENELSGMGPDESKTVTISAKDGYGELENDAIMEVDRTEFPDSLELEVGVELNVTDKDDEMMYARVVEVLDDIIKLDTNHPLAGKELNFDVKVLEVRAATSEELSHGHVHSHGHDH